jgi:hypothetical protein
MTSSGCRDVTNPLFSDPADARAYLGELARLWSAWLGGLVVLVFTRGWVTVATAVLVMVALVRLTRPIQRRVDRHFPVETTGGEDARRRRTDRDRMLRALSYGSEPIREASDLTSAGFRWLAMRLVVLCATVGAFAVFVLDFAG